MARTHTRTDDEPTIEIQLAPGASLDGGPFFAAEITDIAAGRVAFYSHNAEPAEWTAEAADVAADVRECLFSGELVRLALAPSDDALAVSIELPVRALPSHTRIGAWAGGVGDERAAREIRDQTTADRLAHKIRRHGGVISTDS